MSTLSDLQLNAATVVAWVLSTLGMGLIGLACIKVLDHPYAALGMAFVAFGCTTQVNARIRDCTSAQQSAFELGRESVRQLRR